MTINVGEVAMIPIASIEIGDRTREEMGDLEGLEDSMKRSGLIAPLAVKKGVGDEQYLLLAGERRLGVLIKNGAHSVPVRIYPSNISELEVKAIELAENFYRKDFEWYEYDSLVRETHEVQQSIHGKKISTLADAPGWGMKETAEMIGVSKGSVSTAIKRSEAREAFPELFQKCKTQHDASKVISSLEETVIKEALANKIESERVEPTKQTLINSFILKDFFEGVKEIPDESIHFVEIDPPYAIDLPKAKKGEHLSSYGDSYNEINSSVYQDFLINLFKVCYQKMTEHSWLICWFAPEPWFEIVYQEIINAGFSTTRMCGIWTKPSGQSKRPEMHLANSYETFFYAWKGRPAIARPGRSNIFNHSPVPPQQKVHPTERPVELTSDIYSTFTWPGSRILIPFLGSGNGLISAQNLGMSALGYELSKSYRDSFLVKVYKM
jgi:ParB/RepB/Spo0J family partition protein